MQQHGFEGKHVCPIPNITPDSYNDRAVGDILWSCPCLKQYRLNRIVRRWFRYYPPAR